MNGERIITRQTKDSLTEQVEEGLTQRHALGRRKAGTVTWELCLSYLAKMLEVAPHTKQEE